MRKLLESMTKFAGEPAQKPGDQVRGTEPAKKKKSGEHPFQDRLVGGESVFRELEQQLVEGALERQLREEFEQFNEEFELAGVGVAYDLGRRAYKERKTITDNPYSATREARKYNEWEKGLERGKHDANDARLFRNSIREQGVAEGDVDAGKPVKPEPKNPQNDYFARRKKERDMAEEQVTEYGANNPAQPAAPGAPAALPQAGATPNANTPINPADAMALKNTLSKLKTSVPGLDVTKASTALAKADANTPLSPGDQKVTSTMAPELANVMKNPQMAGQLKMMIDKAGKAEQQGTTP